MKLKAKSSIWTHFLRKLCDRFTRIKNLKMALLREFANARRIKHKKSRHCENLRVKRRFVAKRRKLNPHYSVIAREQSERSNPNHANLKGKENQCSKSESINFMFRFAIRFAQSPKSTFDSQVSQIDCHDFASQNLAMTGIFAFDSHFNRFAMTNP